MFGQSSTARFSVPSVIGEEPNMNCRRCDRSRFSMPGEFTIMLIMVGTSAILVTRCSAMASRQVSTSKRGMKTCVPAAIVIDKVDMPSVR